MVNFLNKEYSGILSTEYSLVEMKYSPGAEMVLTIRSDIVSNRNNWQVTRF